MQYRLATYFVLLTAGAVVGCGGGDTVIPAAKKDNGAQSSGVTAVEQNGGSSGTSQGGAGQPTSWPGFPNLPYVPIMTEVDGIDIPREPGSKTDYKVGEPVPADVNNSAAKGNATNPETGGTITVRFNAEPKTLNPITETSAYQTYIYGLVQDPLAWQNPETFKFEPHVAKRWVIEDSVKLRHDFSGRERLLVRGSEAPTDQLKIKVDEAKPDAQPVLLLTVDAAKKPAGDTWVLARPLTDGKEDLHLWSNERGELNLNSVPAGEYEFTTGFELYGELVADGENYRLTPLTVHNDIKEPLTLKKTDVVDVQQKTVFTYFLQDNVKWSDGTPFTSKDLEFAYRVINNPIVDGDSIRTYYANVVECKSFDKTTIRMKCRQQYFQAFEFTAALSLYTPPLHLFEKHFKDREDSRTLVLEELTPEQERKDKKISVRGQEFAKAFNTFDEYNMNPLGIGPYTINSSWSKQTRQLTLTRRKDYWGARKGGFLDRIIVKFIEDSTTALRSLEAGEIDFLWRVQPEQFFKDLAGPPDWVKKNYVKASWYSPAYAYVGWNARKPLFSDRRVRLALTMLYNRAEFLEKQYYGAGVLVSGSQYTFGPAYDQAVKPIAYSPRTAADLLAEAGWTDTNGDNVLDKAGQPFRFELAIPNGSAISRTQAEVIQASFKKEGIQVDVRESEWAAFVERLQSRDFDAVQLQWAMELESDPFQLWHSSGAGEGSRSSNYVSFDNPQGDMLIERIRRSVDAEERKRLEYDFHRILDAEQPYMFLYTPKDLGLYHQKIRGVKFYALRPGFELREWYIPNALR